MQVYVGDKLKGTFNIMLRPGAREHRIAKMTEPLARFSPGKVGSEWLDEIAMPTVEQIVLPITVRSIRINRIDEMLGQDHLFHMIAQHHIPPDTDKIIDQISGDTTLRWKVFRVEPDVYEEIFDMREFEPV